MLDAGVYHPDLHPGNVMIDPQGQAWLIDFDKAVLFSEPELGDRCIALGMRWRRSVRKHGLSESFCESFDRGLKGS